MRHTTVRCSDETQWAIGVGKLHVLLRWVRPGVRMPAWRFRYRRFATIEPTWNLRWRLRSRVWQLRVVWARWEL